MIDVKRFRTDNNISQLEICTVLGIKQPYLSAIENGKRIEELLEVTHISDDSFFLVSETDLTRKITLTYLRNAFNGDTATVTAEIEVYDYYKIDDYLFKKRQYEQRTDRVKLNLRRELEGLCWKYERYIGAAVSPEEVQEILSQINQSYDDWNDKWRKEVEQLYRQYIDEVMRPFADIRSDLLKNYPVANKDELQMLPAIKERLSDDLNETEVAPFLTYHFSDSLSEWGQQIMNSLREQAMARAQQLALAGNR